MRKRILQLGCLLAVVTVGAACSSSSPSTAQTPLTARPPGSTASTTAGSTTAACGGTPASGVAGGGDVLVPGDIPDSQAFVTYQATTDGYHVNVPEGWARTAMPGIVTFSDKFNSIRVEVTAQASQPSVGSARATDLAALASSAPCFQPGAISTVSRKAGPAVLITYRASSPPDPVTGKVVRQDLERYEFWQAGKLAVVTLASPQGSDNVDPWRKVTDSFAWGP